MPDSLDLDRHIGILRASFWSETDPEGRAFAPLAEAYRQKGDLDEASALVTDGLGRHPQFATGHLIAARVARDGGDHVRAREHLDRVLDLDGGNVVALVERAECCLAEGDRDGALLDLREALRREPGNTDVRARLEMAEEGERWQPPTAARTSEGPVDRDESGSEGLIFTRTMGDIYARQGFVAEAVQVYERLLEQSPGDADLSARLSELRAVTETADIPRPGTPTPAGREDETPVWDPSLPEPATEAASVDRATTIGQYFDDLLAWVPGAVPIGTLAPGETPGPVPVEALAPDGESPSEGGPSDDGDAHEAGQVSGETGGGEEAGAMDDFTRWLKGLST